MAEVRVSSLLSLENLPLAKDVLNCLDPEICREIQPQLEKLPLLYLITELLKAADQTPDSTNRENLLILLKIAVAQHPFTRQLFEELVATLLLEETPANLLPDLPLKYARLAMEMLTLLAELLATEGKLEQGLKCFRLAGLIARRFKLRLNEGVACYQMGHFQLRMGALEEAEQAFYQAAVIFEPVSQEVFLQTQQARAAIYYVRLLREVNPSPPLELAKILEASPRNEQLILLAQARRALERSELGETGKLCQQIRKLPLSEDQFLAEVLLLESTLARRQGDYEKADLLLRKAENLPGASELNLKISREKFFFARDLSLDEVLPNLLDRLQNENDPAFVDYQKGLVEYKKSNYSAAEKLFLSSLEKAKDDTGRANCYGMLWAVTDDPREAREYIHKAIGLYVKTGNKLDHAVALSHLAITEMNEGFNWKLSGAPSFSIYQFYRAQKLLELAEAIALELGNESFLLDLKILRAELESYRERFSYASKLYEEALTHVEIIYLSLTNRGQVSNFMRHYTLLYEKALRCALASGEMTLAYFVLERGKARRFLRDMFERTPGFAASGSTSEEERQLLTKLEPLRRKITQGRLLTVEERQALSEVETSLIEMWRARADKGSEDTVPVARQVLQPLSFERLHHLVFAEDNGPQTQTGSNQGKDSEKAGIEYQEPEELPGGGIVTCPVCQVDNQIGSSFCSSCEEILPKTVSVDLDILLGTATEEQLKKAYAEKLYNTAIRLFHKGKVEKARKMLEEALQYYQHPDYYFYLGLCSLAKQDAVSTRGFFKKVFEMQFAHKYPFWPLPVSPTTLKEVLRLLEQATPDYSQILKDIFENFREFKEKQKEKALK